MDNERIDGLSLDTAATEQDKLRALFPQCFVEGKLDERKLLALLGSFETLDANDRERYEFRWKGKQECLQLAGKRSAGTLRPCRADSVDWENTRNVYIEGDNLEVLKLLQTAYYRKVKMIYIDPPYNTGNDFVYADDFADPLARYREVTQQTTKSNPESMGRFHTNWLNMMYPRLQLASNLLRDDGVIFVSIDDNEVHNLRKLCDEVFGEENFVASLVWEKGRKNDARLFSVGHEYIVVYAKSALSLRENNVYWREDKPGAHDIFAEFQRLREIHGDDFTTIEKELKTFYSKLPAEHPAKKHARYNKVDENGVWRDDNLSWPGGGGPEYDVIHPETGKPCKVPTGGWRYPTPERMNEMIESGVVVFRKDHTEPPIKKSYLVRKAGRLSDEDESIGRQVMGTYFYRSAIQATNMLEELIGKRVFDYPKDCDVLQRLISYVTGSDKDALVMDFFSGSATTAHAVMQLNAEDGGNRRFILVQLPEITDEKSEAAKAGYANICEIGKARIRKAGAKIKADSPLTTAELDTGFRVFKLDSSNLKLWDNSPITGENALTELEARIYGMLNILKPDRSDEDVVYEVMLKLGQDLCEPIVVIELPNDRRVYGVGADVTFIVCITRDVVIEDAQIMAEYAPGRVVFADACFNNSTDKSNVKLCLRDKGIAIRVL
ncbi:site-specific DNA-methyltransferase [Clostridia bacterium]|nr:site-specific DNA-methyltransferase [Clostridia bacterium]GHV33433.1 site-specific DNA-methyltransferase [Clostridia bacterium]